MKKISSVVYKTSIYLFCKGNDSFIQGFMQNLEWSNGDFICLPYPHWILEIEFLPSAFGN